ncbi:MAG: hypothetical protein E3J52_11095 [Promethearchaeota archaeon]|nr:MAG: hypothetical protein E3J52_11095 [Candidatus Lokiarchaeota archaeon]
MITLTPWKVLRDEMSEERRTKNKMETDRLIEELDKEIIARQPKIKSIEENEEKVALLEDISFGKNKRSPEKDILFEQILAEVLEYDEYICPESVFKTKLKEERDGNT